MAMDWACTYLSFSETCAGGKVYQSCGSPCTSALTCDTYEDRHDIACTAVCVEGCFCPEGTVDHNGVCISPVECPMYQSTSDLDADGICGIMVCSLSLLSLSIARARAVCWIT